MFGAGEMGTELCTRRGKHFPFPESVSLSGSGSGPPHPIQQGLPPGEGLGTLKVLPSSGGLNTNPPAYLRPATLDVLDADALSSLRYTVKVLERGYGALFSPLLSSTPIQLPQPLPAGAY